ncbi:hypothetical protein KIW84_034182 [Lathyrus oleraceus]|uniref:YGGT family protein n=1 Tax=Pisum sativum TaxID=3888 RepID=A0A9D4Y2U0_PEA|nr:hypothetical protein KIW84_034182 [Pisum sativum]
MASLAATMGIAMTVTSHFSTSSRLLAFQLNLILQERQTKTFSISTNRKTTVTACTVTAAPPAPQSPTNDDTVNLSGSTRVVTTLFGIAVLGIKAFVNILPPSELCLSIGTSSSSLFFVAFVLGPLSAIRDLCDPYLSLLRNVIPPVFDTLDISPLLAFVVLGTLASLLTVPV